MNRKLVLVGLGGVAVGLLLGFLAAVMLQNLLTATVRSKAKRTVADARSISLALEKYRQEKGGYPPLDGRTESLSPYLVPTYLRRLPSVDSFGQPYVVCMRGETAAVVAAGQYGAIVEGGEVVSSAGWDPPLEHAPN